MPSFLIRSFARKARPPGALLALTMVALLLSACTVVSERRSAQTLYDLGAPPSQSAASAPAGQRLPAVVMGDISVPAWLDSTRMFYRLEYDNPQEARTYAQARWTAPPSRLLLQRLKTRLSQAGMPVLGSSDGAVGLASLRLEADDFSQVFPSLDKSSARVVVRASVVLDRKLVAQKTLTATAPAASADAAGGVQALAQAADAVAADLIAWLASLPLPR